MKRAVLLTLALLSLAVFTWAQEPVHAPAAEGHATAEGHAEGDPYIWWKWANFAILAAVLGYMLNKALPPFFASRTTGIQKGIAEAAKLKADAEARAADMERRLSALGAEIEKIRTSARAEMSLEGDRLGKDTGQKMARLQLQAEQEVGALTKHATEALKADSAKLAIELAAERVRARMAPDTQSALVDGFLNSLGKPGQGARL